MTLAAKAAYNGATILNSLSNLFNKVNQLFEEMCRAGIQGDPVALVATCKQLTDETRRLIECCGGNLVEQGVQVSIAFMVLID